MMPHPVDTLTRIMREQGISRTALAEMTGRNWTTVARWLAAADQGRTRPDAVSRRVIEKRFGIPSDAWLTDAERGAIERITKD